VDIDIILCKIAGNKVDDMYLASPGQDQASYLSLVIERDMTWPFDSARRHVVERRIRLKAREASRVKQRCGGRKCCAETKDYSRPLHAEDEDDTELPSWQILQRVKLYGRGTLPS
jgi:hypothetical protein